MRPAWDRRRAAAIAVGGIAGAATRWAVLAAVDPTGGVPWVVLVINVLGSVLLGVLLAEEWIRPAFRLVLHDLGAIGFCGGLTTFSTFTVEVVELARDGAVQDAVIYGILSVILSLLGVVAGAAALRRVRAASLPLEEEP
jgi:CrcB protein